MPTIKPRIQVVVDSDLYELLQGVAKHTDQSVSALVRDLLESMAPAYAVMLDLHQELDEIMDHAKKGLIDGTMLANEMWAETIEKTRLAIGAFETSTKCAEGVPPSSNTGAKSGA